MVSKELNFLISTLTEQNPFICTSDLMNWLELRRQAHSYRVEKISFSAMDQWSFHQETGNLMHDSGRFFSIEGIRVHSNYGPIPVWEQPIINQPEIGILGILTKKFDGILYFLMQAKMEPGNIDQVQLAPTLQATRSNYTRVHQGQTTPYLNYFQGQAEIEVLVDSLQSEQGARFLRKRNRNMIIETTDEVPCLEDYCWLTLGQIQALLQVDNIVNMDARTVLACIPLTAPELDGVQAPDLLNQIQKLGVVDVNLLQDQFDPFKIAVINGALEHQRALHDIDHIISWFTEQKVTYELDVEQIPLNSVDRWYQTESEIRHEEDNYFSVIAVAVEAENREVTHWTQPLVKPCEEGLVAYIVKQINGVLHFLVQAKVEPGNFDVVEMAPTIQCITRSYRQLDPDDRPEFLDYVLQAQPEQLRYSTLQSEEGGRFFQEQNRNQLIEVGDEFPVEVPDYFIWMTLYQLKQFIKYNNFLNVQGRCLLSGLGVWNR